MSRSRHIAYVVLRLTALSLVCAAVPLQAVRAQQERERSAVLPAATISLVVRDTLVQLPHRFIAANSDTLRAGPLRILRRGEDYAIDYREGRVYLRARTVAGMVSDSGAAGNRLTVSYSYFPFAFQDTYYRRKLVTLHDSTGTDSLRIARAAPAFNVEDIFGPDLQKSGSIVRGFTIGSNRDLSLNSGLRMQLSGRIASDVEIAASLTDENTPIQPEGTTQTLQEFDKVFVEIKSSNLAATLGDFTIELPGTEFARLTRKLQGAQGTGTYQLGGSQGSVLIAGAVTRGKFATNQFGGLEGVQGPYLLSGRNGERGIIIVAGMERIYVNGELQTRGETNDYTVDYGTGEVTFTPRRLITSASRIVIDFEYTDRQYSRSLFGAQTTNTFFRNRAKLSLTFLREADDQDAPIDFSLTDSARAVLAAAGSDRNRATLSGVARVDSNGFYVRVDTMLANGSPAVFYRYAPGDPAALYNVVFTRVPFGSGEYVRQQVGVFAWKGPGGGDYVPLRFLPLPQAQQLMDAKLDLTPAAGLAVGAEYAHSLMDPNRLSAQDNAAGGDAINLTAGYAPRNVTLAGVRLGDVNVKLHERKLSANFVPIDRTNDIEFSRKWGIDTSISSKEEIQEATIGIIPDSGIAVSGGYGKIVRGDEFHSVRNEGQVALRGPALPLLDYIIESVRSRERLLDNASSWLRQRGTISRQFWLLSPGLKFEAENRSIRSITAGEKKPGSFSFTSYAPTLELRDVGKISATAELGWRVDNTFLGGSVVRESRSFTQSYAARLSDWHTLSSALDVTLRKKIFSAAFKAVGNSDIRTVLVRSQSRYSPFNRGVETDLLYEVSTERSSRLQRVYVRVTQGTGNYRYLGDVNNNGLADESEFVLTRFDGDFLAITVPTDELSPIIDLKTGFRLHLAGSRLVGSAANSFQSLLSGLSSETYVRVEEKSSERDLAKIYLLHLSHFQQDATTISGSSLFTQDVNVFEGASAFSSRLRFSQRRGLTNFSGGLERAFVRERSVRIRWQLVEEIANQVDYVNKVDRVTGAEESNRLRDVLSDGVTFDLSYRPQQDIEVGLKMEMTHAADRLRTPVLGADLNIQSLRWVYAFQGAGQARVEASREEVLLAGSAVSFPYELTGGRVVGKTWTWRLAFDYRMTQFIQATINYDGRTEGGARPVHTARGEVRAFF